MERCVRGHTAGSVEPRTILEQEPCGPPEPGHALPKLPPQPACRGGQPHPAEKGRRPRRKGWNWGTFPDNSSCPRLSPQQRSPPGMESGVPQPTLSQVLTNPSAPAGRRGAPVAPQPLLGRGTHGGACTSPFPGGPRLRSYVGGGEGGGRNPGKVASVLRGGRGPVAEPPPQHSNILPTHTPRPPAGAGPRTPSGISTVAAREGPAYSTASPVQESLLPSAHTEGTGRALLRVSSCARGLELTSAEAGPQGGI